MKYKVGDRVRIKSLDWYNENKNEDGNVLCGKFAFLGGMEKFCSETLTILEVVDDGYFMLEDYPGYMWTDEMIEYKVEDEFKPKFKVGNRVKWFNHTCTITSIDTNENTYTYLIKHNDYREDKTFAKWVPESELSFDGDKEIKNLAATNIPDGPYTVTYNSPSMNDSISKNIIYNEIVLPDGYIFKDENGNVINATKIVLEKKKKEYPKTYCECKDILGLWDIDDTERGYYKTDLIDKLQMLLICRDAYWKIAGEEMGLGKPWEPDYSDLKNTMYGLYDKLKYSILNPSQFVFPTAEMRDAFKENFGPDIESCKELL